ncbi:MAG: hypothetical protein PSX81_06410 [bacterium]|nr:hypothetical protein [bacterium]
MRLILFLFTITIGIFSCNKKNTVKDLNFFWIEKDFPSRYGKVGIYFGLDSLGYPFELDKDEFITSFYYYHRNDAPCDDITCNQFDYSVNGDTIRMEHTTYLFKFTYEDTLVLYSIERDWPFTRKFYKDGKNTMNIRKKFKLQ